MLSVPRFLLGHLHHCLTIVWRKKQHLILSVLLTIFLIVCHLWIKYVRVYLFVCIRLSLFPSYGMPFFSFFEIIVYHKVIVTSLFISLLPDQPTTLKTSTQLNIPVFTIVQSQQPLRERRRLEPVNPNHHEASLMAYVSFVKPLAYQHDRSHLPSLRMTILPSWAAGTVTSAEDRSNHPRGLSSDPEKRGWDPRFP